MENTGWLSSVTVTGMSKLKWEEKLCKIKICLKHIFLSLQQTDEDCVRSEKPKPMKKSRSHNTTAFLKSLENFPRFSKPMLSLRLTSQSVQLQR